MSRVNLTTEPVSLPALLTAAVLATWNLIVIIFSIDETVAAGANIVIGAWMAVIAFWMRSKVSPVRSKVSPVDV